jgi:hypothetical protein
MTLQELYRKTLERLGQVAAGEDAPPEDVQLVAGRYVGLYELLNSEELVAWAVDDPLPDYVEIPLVSMLACHCAREFGIVGGALAELMAEGGMSLPQMSWAERQLRRLMARAYVSQPATPEYY